MKSKSINSFTGTLFRFFLFSSFAFLLNACSSDNEDIDSPGPGGNGKSSYPVAKAIDLGLPSGTKWASWNIGASAPEEFGSYFAWGEIEEKDSYYWNTYSHCDGRYDMLHDIGENIAGTEYDVANVKWGGSWAMPTNSQMRELFDNCTYAWMTQKGVNGVLFTGLNGNSIFLPASGYREYESIIKAGTYGIYWSSICYRSRYAENIDLAQNFMTYDCSSDRCYGASVRAVITPEELPSFNPKYPVAEAIDLGLPSGTKWASWNVGASAPEDLGGYYAWGETEVKKNYNWSTYRHCDGMAVSCHYIGDNIAGTEYDVAHVKWGGSWRMPTFDQMYELEQFCTETWMIQNGVYGSLLKGPNGATIFLPASGYRQDEGLEYGGNYERYWTSSLYNYSDDCAVCGIGYRAESRFLGLSVRPVISPVKDYPIAEAIDLGLPSGTKWASWNVGASKPEEYGGYYAWGETEEKDCYDWSTYIYCDGSQETCHHIGDDIAGTKYDVAHVKWGGSWRMPTKAQQEELRLHCFGEWTQLNGVNGTLITGPNGKSIFLPAASLRWGGRYYDDEGESGNYWSSSLIRDESHVHYLGQDYKHWSGGDYGRAYGLSVRAVCP